MRLTVRPPGFLLSVLSILWIGAGVLGAVVLLRGSYLIGSLGVLLGVLSLGLWFQWSFVRLPLIFYLGVIGISGMVLLLFNGFDARTAIRGFGFLYFAYLVYRWRPVGELPLKQDPRGEPIVG